MAIAVHRKTKRHSHKCCNCGRIWSHSDNRRENEKAHKCRGCGGMSWYQYDEADSCEHREMMETLIELGLI